jgi:fermentation-respiration switch protein FrsA (DUF1100 family)
VRRQRLLATALLSLVLVAAALIVALGGEDHAGTSAAGHANTERSTAKRRPKIAPSSFAVGLQTLPLVDSSRSITLPDGASGPRQLPTQVRYPALGPATRTDVSRLPPARADGPFPLIVFGHGFDVSPSLYRRLLQSWARAGYVVAAPAFPLESPDAPGGPNEADLANQPTDMRFVITQMLKASSGSGSLAGLIDPSRVAVAGQSDGGDTALALAYDSRFRDRRIGAALILSGAEIPALGSFVFPSDGPPLLATQGTADTINPPTATEEFFSAAHRPKYLLRLLGAGHLPPYSVQQPQLGVVERVSRDFLDGYLKHHAGALHGLGSAGSAPGTATMLAEP